MKKIITITFVLSLFILSCSSDDPQNEIQNFDPNTILPKKIIKDDSRTGFEFYSNYIYEFFYNGSKLNNIEVKYSDFENGILIEGEYSLNFTYNGNFISKIELINNLGQVEMYFDFTYNNNKLVNKKFFFNNSLIDNFDYIYNSNSITRTMTSFDTDGNPNPNTITDNFIITNNLISKYNFTNINYSSTNSPFKNISGVQDAFVEGGVDLDNYSFYGDIFFSTQKNMLNNLYGNFSYIYNNVEFPSTVMYFYNQTNLNFNNSINYHIIYQ
ncbi:hypothetical protein [Flavobacterium sp.]|jgi:hypothetical protein|uniref:hypothetical protein n=1 Tax=Flavobacterium sp. TaxID=239 RepID=UPI0037BFF918